MGRSWRYTSIALVFFAASCASPALSSNQGPASRSTPVATADKPAPAAARAAAGDATLPPVSQNSVRFAVLGDTGTGERAQYDVGAALWRSRASFPFDFVIMLGDNMYGSERPQDYNRKFELPYKPLLDAGVQFYAALGNHDDPNQRFYKFFNMNEKRYYTFKKGPLTSGVRFFALDSNYMDREQLDWVTKELANSDSPWKIAFFHHPLYSSGGTHGSEVDLRQQLEPLFMKNNMSVVFAGHEHFYERVKPQKGVYYFTSGGAAKLRKGDIRKTGLTDFGYDEDYTYMLIEIDGDTMHFQTLTRGGKLIDKGSIRRPNPSLGR